MLWCWNPALDVQWSHEQTVPAVSNAIFARIQLDQQAVSAGQGQSIQNAGMSASIFSLPHLQIGEAGEANEDNDDGL